MQIYDQHKRNKIINLRYQKGVNQLSIIRAHQVEFWKHPNIDKRQHNKVSS